MVFSEIFNAQKATQLNDELNASESGDEWLGNRINALHLDEKKPPKEGDLYIFVNIDHMEPVVIHCKQLKIEN